MRAEDQRQLAEKNLDIARDAADGLVVDLARKLRSVEGMSTAATRQILERAQSAYDKLANTTPNDPQLLGGRMAMHAEFVETYLGRGDLVAARKSAEART